MPEEAKPETASDSTGSSRSSLLRRYAPLALIAVLALGFFAFNLDEVLSFETLRLYHAELRAFVAGNFTIASLAYIAIYTTVVAASVPGAAVLTVTGGLLFGMLAGTLLTVVGATLGAAGIFLIARSAFGDALRKRAGGALARMADGFRRDAFNYLLVLRLVPLFPFFLVNLAPAFLGVRLRTFVVATFIGIAPGTFVFSSVGSGLGSVFERGEDFSAASVLTPEIVVALVGLAALALIPVIYRRVIAARV
jgi:uncharacterized membrane protein YdjX (TVP38/TMEM64 family)